MKTMFFFWVVLGLLCCDAGAAADGFADGYNRGNAQYRKGDYAAAILAYKQVLAQGIKNGDVYYNLGNAYYKSGQLGHAILAYERALRLEPDDEDVRANLKFVNAQKLDKDPEDDANVLTRFLRVVYDFFSINLVSVCVSVCVFGLGGMGILWVFVPGRRWLWAGGLVAFGLVLVLGCGLLAFKVHQRGIPEAVILSAEVMGRSGPGEDFLQVFTLHEGTKVVVERQEGSWLLVRLQAGAGGWLPVEALERI